MNTEEAFAGEYQVLENLNQVLESVSSESPLYDELKAAAKNYQKLLRQSAKLMKISDNLQNQVTSAKEELQSTNDRLLFENEKNHSLQKIIRQFIPHSTWAKADLNSQSADLEIPEEEKYLACLFLDVVNFTNFAETRKPSEVIQTLNRLFIPLVEIIYRKDGDIDKFIGDAIFAVFSTARQAVEAAVQIQSLLSGFDDFQVRIGIHSGKVIVGNVGGHLRKDNTYMGDTVNTSSRLEGLCFPGEIVISQKAAEEAQCAWMSYTCEKVKLKGKDERIKILRINVNTYEEAEETASMASNTDIHSS